MFFDEQWNKTLRIKLVGRDFNVIPIGYHNYFYGIDSKLLGLLLSREDQTAIVPYLNNINEFPMKNKRNRNLSIGIDGIVFGSSKNIHRLSSKNQFRIFIL